MGICASCLGGNRRENHDSESSRLLDEDLYQPGYGYGALNHTQQANQPDPGYLKREREALEAICQRASDSVIDIWSLQPQHLLQPQATLHNSSSKGSAQPPVTVTTTVPTEPNAPNQPTSTKRITAPKHWGEVVINPRNGKNSRPGSSANEDGDKDVFGVLKVC
ncbi:hypothetical protein P175DRAFT_0553304 [Aspergillus ochraceoroseus IBT 24754]|uniref:Ragulator complex protein LAMTOR1 n=3 Tax=Aspergillus subgen. Nidulantes TaxID=2720870 RepID=A0A0F8WJ24_9EURO|nr:uncharacterized protein P175DRAFT_0553304 [Aspergillus ochraceoroseus IBT 24754]KKK17725.1 hypothetical protein ARAM_005983 [Aspergillus rambellii]KKK22903.1 hypothetical protein AOCH_000512 [Aspergillus ochraceoroseus]PTU24015.1 hypothetical protein P175DRAFT_0553304 [Aspergillus ochraceoroseus IBT 24754]